MAYQTILFTGLFLLKSFLSLGQEIQPKSNVTSTPTIVFICEHGAGMSPIAAAYFNKIAKEKGFNAQAIFRGINAASALGPSIQNGLLKDGFDITGWKPNPLSKYDTENAYQVVTLNCFLPIPNSTAKPIIQWKNIPISEGYVSARDDIKSRVTQFIATLIEERVH